MEKGYRLEKEVFEMDGKKFDVFYLVASYQKITAKIKLKTNDTEKQLLELILAEQNK